MDNPTFSEDTVHVTFSLSGTYINYAGGALASIFEHTTHHLALHIITSDTREELTEDHKKKINDFAASYGHEVYYYNVQERLPELCAKLESKRASWESANRDGRWASFDIMSFSAVWYADILPKEIKKIVCIGVDTIFLFDIAEMYNEDTGEVGIAAVPEMEATFGNMLKKEICESGVVPYDKYFCMGQMVVDLEKLRARPTLFDEGLEILLKNPKYDCVEQDILNYFFCEKYKRLSIKYGVFTDALRLVGRQDIRPWSYHYAGNAIDMWQMNDAYNRLFMEYFAKSPFFSVDFFANSMERLKQYFYASSAYSRSIFNGLCGRKIVFVCNKASEKFVQDHFDIKDKDSIRLTDEEPKIATAEDIEREMKKSDPNDKCFVLFLLGYEGIKKYLTEKGFKEFHDFVDAFPMIQGIQNQLSYITSRNDFLNIKG